MKSKKDEIFEVLHCDEDYNFFWTDYSERLPVSTEEDKIINYKIIKKADLVEKYIIEIENTLIKLKKLLKIYH